MWEMRTEQVLSVLTQLSLLYFWDQNLFVIRFACSTVILHFARTV